MESPLDYPEAIDLYRSETAVNWAYSSICFSDCVLPTTGSNKDEITKLSDKEAKCIIGCTQKLSFLDNMRTEFDTAIELAGEEDKPRMAEVYLKRRMKDLAKSI